MKRLLTTTALAISSMLCMPAMAQPKNDPPLSPNATNPSAPPAPEGPTTQRGSSGSGAMMSGDSTMQQDKTAQTKSAHKTKKNTGQHAKKPREQDASPVATPTAPSGPKGDSPDPVQKP